MSADLKNLVDPPPDYSKATAEHGLPAAAAAARPPPPAGGPGPGPGPGPRAPLPLNLPIISYLKSKRVILASASPRRRQLLAQVGLTNLEITPSTKPEDLDKTAYGPYEYVAATARQKCLDVYETALKTHLASIPDPDVVISADTVIVTRDGRVLEKPRSEAEHIKMLRHLRDTRMHRVLTSVCVLAPREDARSPGYEIATHTEETKVYFCQEHNGLPDDVIDAYVKTREGADKAGGYGVQGIGGLVLVEKIEGNFDNVVGLPVRQTLALAEKAVFKQDEDEVAEEDDEE